MFIVGILDVVLALKNSFLEKNIGLIGLYNLIGPFWGWTLIILVKFLLIFGIVWVVWRLDFKSERHMFFVVTLFAFLLIGQAYGAYTGARGWYQVNQIEETIGEPLSFEVQDMLRIQIKDSSVKTSLTQTFWISIFPLALANLAFYMFEKLYLYATFRRRRWRE